MKIYAVTYDLEDAFIDSTEVVYFATRELAEQHLDVEAMAGIVQHDTELGEEPDLRETEIEDLKADAHIVEIDVLEAVQPAHV